MNATQDISTAAKLVSPIYYMDPYLSTIHILFGVIGIPINLLVCGTIIFTRQLQTTQNIAWLGVGFSNIFWLSGLLLEIAAAGEYLSFCLPLFNTIFGLPDASLILNLHLSMLDRRIFVNHTSFYRKYVTKAWILVIQITCFALITLLLKGRIFYQTLSLSLKQILDEINFGMLFSLIFIGVVSLFVHYKQFQENKVGKHPVNSFATSVSNYSDDTKSKNIANGEAVVEQTRAIVPNQSTEDNKENIQKGNTCFNISEKSIAINDAVPNQPPKQADEGPVIIPKKNQRFSQSEVQGYCSIKINIKALFLFAVVPLAFLLFSFFCLLIAVISGSLFDSCSTWFSTNFYLRGILLGFYTAVFNPLCFVGHSHDFTVLEMRCNPMGEIARATRRFTVFNKPIPPCDPAINV